MLVKGSVHAIGSMPVARDWEGRLWSTCVFVSSRGFLFVCVLFSALCMIHLRYQVKSHHMYLAKSHKALKNDQTRFIRLSKEYETIISHLQTRKQAVQKGFVHPISKQIKLLD